MSGPSDKAVEAIKGQFGGSPYYLESVAERVLAAAHDPALGLDRSVCLRDVVDALRSQPHGMARDTYADFIEREFGGKE